MFQLPVILRVRPDSRATEFLLACGLIGTALGINAAPAGERRIGDAHSSQEYRLPRENLLVYRGPDDAENPLRRPKIGSYEEARSSPGCRP